MTNIKLLYLFEAQLTSRRLNIVLNYKLNSITVTLISHITLKGNNQGKSKQTAMRKTTQNK